MGYLGMGIIVGLLRGNANSAEVFRRNMGKEIEAIDLLDNRLLFTFRDGAKMQLVDTGQQCSEERYMHSDDPLEVFVGSRLLGAEVRPAPEMQCEGCVHEVQFLLVTTSGGSFMVETHNEHNGWYGGFRIVAEDVPC